MLPGKESVYTVSGIDRFSFDRDAVELMEREIFSAPKDKIAKVTIARGKTRVTLEPNDEKGESWKADGKPADTKLALEVIDLFGRYEASAFAGDVDLAPGLKQLGLAPASKEATVLIALKDGKSFELWIGEKVDTLYWVKLKDNPTVWRVPEWKVVPLVRVAAKDLLAAPTVVN